MGRVFEGILEIDRVPGGKRLQPTYLRREKPAPVSATALAELEGQLQEPIDEDLIGFAQMMNDIQSQDTSLIISYRPDPDYYQYVEKRVRIIGEIYRPDPEAQQVMATHLIVHDIQLAEGETPYDPLPTELPEPPLAQSREQLMARDERWVRVQGVLEGLVDVPAQYSPNAKICMQDGYELTVHWVSRDRWAHYVGQSVSVTAQAHVGTDGSVTLSGCKRIGPA